MSNQEIPILVCTVIAGIAALLVIRKRLCSPRGTVEGWLRELSAGRQPIHSKRRDHRFSITFDSSGFAVMDTRSRSSETVRMAWNEVARVTVFKRDLFAVDCICLFASRADGTGIEVDEDMEGFMAFCEELPAHLRGCVQFEEWYWPVAAPAFATNQREIYQRLAPPES